ncbi:hypothetical protein STSO111631_02575 [Stackebrandtia soli]
MNPLEPTDITGARVVHNPAAFRINSGVSVWVKCRSCIRSEYSARMFILKGYLASASSVDALITSTTTSSLDCRCLSLLKSLQKNLIIGLTELL